MTKAPRKRGELSIRSFRLRIGLYILHPIGKGKLVHGNEVEM